MDKSAPFLSIIIPVYNAELYIEECLYSIINQNYEKLEIVLVDNNSTDSSYSICENFANQYSFIKLFSEKVQGTASARNLGLKNAQGKYIWFIDGDDFIHKFSLKIINVLLENKDYDVLKFNYISFQNEINEVDNSDIIYNNNHNLNSIFQSSVCVFVYNNTFIQKHNLHFDINNYFEDALFNIQLFEYDFKILAIENILYYYRKTPDSKSLKINNEVLRKRIVSMHELIKSCKNNEQTYFKEKIKSYHYFIVESISFFYKTSNEDIDKKLVDFLVNNVPKLDFHPRNTKKNLAIRIYNFDIYIFLKLMKYFYYFKKKFV